MGLNCLAMDLSPLGTTTSLSSINTSWIAGNHYRIGGADHHQEKDDNTRPEERMHRPSLIVQLLLVAISLTCASSWQRSSRSSFRATPTAFRGGASSQLTTTGVDAYLATLESIKSQVLQEIAVPEISKLRQSIVEEGSVIEGFGSKADELCDRAVAAFCDRAPAPPTLDGGNAAAIYDAVLADVEKSVDAPLQVLYLKQLGYLREMALQQFRGRATDNKASGSSYYESMLRADADFVEAAVSSTRTGGNSGDNVWDYTQERGYLQAVLNLAAEQAAQRNELVVETAEKQQAAMSVLQYQNQMIQQLQNQLYGQSSPWNIGMAYRIPDTNFNVQGSYQQGRANVQISCVPDEYAPLLGPNGFTNGVGPGNLGLSLNLSL
jgi:hypothetical protein